MQTKVGRRREYPIRPGIGPSVEAQFECRSAFQLRPYLIAFGGTRIMNLKEQRAEALAKAKGILDGAKAGNRDLTDGERAQVKSHLDAVDGLDAKIKASAEGDALANRLGGFNSDTYFDRDGNIVGAGAAKGVTFMRTSVAARKSQAASIAGRIGSGASLSGRDSLDGVKALLTGSGAIATEVALDATPLPEGKPVPSVLDVIPTQVRPAHYRYLRQVTRTNNAAIVDPGALKPTSVYSITPVDNALQVVAHLSEPVDIFLLSDNGSLQTFIASEMLYGIQRAIEAKVVADILGTSGVQATAFDTDAVVTIRNAQTALTLAGFEAGVVVMNAQDWGSITSRRLAQTGAFDLSSGPLDAAAQRLWGTPVALSNAVAIGEAIVLDTNAVSIGTDGNVDLRWDASGALFTHNQSVARAETRTSTDVKQPLGVTVATLHA